MPYAIDLVDPSYVYKVTNAQNIIQFDGLLTWKRYSMKITSRGIYHNRFEAYPIRVKVPNMKKLRFF